MNDGFAVFATRLSTAAMMASTMMPKVQDASEEDKESEQDRRRAARAGHQRGRTVAEGICCGIQRLFHHHW
jgi:hypothetical protein